MSISGRQCPYQEGTLTLSAMAINVQIKIFLSIVVVIVVEDYWASVIQEVVLPGVVDRCVYYIRQCSPR